MVWQLRSRSPDHAPRAIRMLTGGGTARTARAQVAKAAMRDADASAGVRHVARDIGDSDDEDTPLLADRSGSVPVRSCESDEEGRWRRSLMVRCGVRRHLEILDQRVMAAAVAEGMMTTIAHRWARLLCIRSSTLSSMCWVPFPTRRPTSVCGPCLLRILVRRFP
jgi:hypothetical protein